MCRLIAAIILLITTAPILTGSQSPREDFLTWSARQADSIGRQTYKRGRVGGLFDTRLLKTERSYNYKLAGTWLTPETIRASARLIQLRSRLSDEDTLKLVNEAEAAGDSVIMIEIDPREGSGVIPTDWEAFLQPKSHRDHAVTGQIAPKLRDVRALGGVLRRNYDYDRFWAVFPLMRADGSALFAGDDAVAELVVRIHNKEGRIEWPIPHSLRPNAGNRTDR
jgi:hypothetical protein